MLSQSTPALDPFMNPIRSIDAAVEADIRSISLNSSVAVNHIKSLQLYLGEADYLALGVRVAPDGCRSGHPSGWEPAAIAADRALADQLGAAARLRELAAVPEEVLDAVQRATVRRMSLLSLASLGYAGRGLHPAGQDTECPAVKSLRWLQHPAQNRRHHHAGDAGGKQPGRRGRQDVHREVDAKVNPSPARRDAGQAGDRPPPARGARQRETEAQAPGHRRMVAGEAVVRHMVQPCMPDGGHERPRSRSTQPAGPAAPRSTGMSAAQVPAARDQLPALQPAPATPHRAGWRH
jgi:hypothetical protein